MSNTIAVGELVGGRYRVGPQLGRGGMGTVFLATDSSSGRDCAIKALHAKATTASDIVRFKREFRAASRLSHLNCVQVYDMGQAGGQWYFTMEFVRGGNLTRLAGKKPASIVRAMLQTLAALDHIHSKQIVHRDIKPQNILTESYDEAADVLGTVKLSDFGIARTSESDDLAGVGDIVGSLRYMSPEAIDGEQVDPRADLYSLGIVMYELLAKKLPFRPEENSGVYGWITAHRQAVPRPLIDVAPQVTKELNDVVMRLIEKQPEQRFATAAAVYDALAAWLTRTEPRMSLPEVPPLLRSGYLAAPRLVGRTNEIRKIDSFLSAAFQEAKPDAPLAMLIAGEAGMGKSRLLNQLLRMAERTQIRLFIGACRSEPGAAYAPLTKLLQEFGGQGGQEASSSDGRAPSANTKGKKSAVSGIGSAATINASQPMAAKSAEEDTSAQMDLGMTGAMTGGVTGTLGSGAFGVEGGATASAHISATGPTVATGSIKSGAAQSALSLDPFLTPRELGLDGADADVQSSKSAQFVQSMQSLQSVQSGQSARSASVPTFSPPLQMRTDDLEGQHWRFHRQIADGLIRFAAAKPCIVLLEDAQWADGPSMELLKFLLRAAFLARQGGVAVRIAFVITHRPAPNHVELMGFRELAESYKTLVPIDLTPLALSDATELVSSMLGIKPDEEIEQFTARLLANAEGNPLYLAQILFALTASNQLARTATGWNIAAASLATSSLPRTIRDAIGERAARFSVNTKAVLVAAAVIGRQFDLTMLEAVVEGGQAQLLDSLDEAIRAGFVEEIADAVGVFQFAHDRFRESIYDRLPVEEAARLHLQIANALHARSGGVPGVAADLAHHYAKGGEHKKAYRYSVMAADQAMEKYAFTKATDLYGQAIALCAKLGTPVRRELYERHGDACSQSGKYAAATESYNHCLALITNPVERAEILRRSADVEHKRGDTAGGARLIEEVLRTLGFSVPGSGLRLYGALLLSALVFLRYLLFPPALKKKTAAKDAKLEIIARSAIRLTESFYFMDFFRAGFYLINAVIYSERLGPSGELTSACAQAGYVMAEWGFYRLGFWYLDRAKTCGVVAAAPMVDVAWESTLRAYAFTAVGKPVESIAEGRRAEAMYRSCTDALRLRQILAVNCDSPMATGNLPAAEKIATELWHMSEDVSDDRGRGWGRGNLGLIELRRGNLERAIVLLREGMEASGRSGDTAWRLGWTGHLVQAMALNGQLEEAVALGLKAQPELEATHVRVPNLALDGPLLMAAAMLLKRDGKVDRAVRRAVTHVRFWRRHYANSLRQIWPLFMAGGAAWDIASGKIDRGTRGFASAVQDAEQRGYIAELYDIHLLASRIYPEGSAEAKLHAERAAGYQAKMCRTASAQPVQTAQPGHSATA